MTGNAEIPDACVIQCLGFDTLDLRMSDVLILVELAERTERRHRLRGGSHQIDIALDVVAEHVELAAETIVGGKDAVILQIDAGFLVLAMQWSNFAANNDLPAGYLPSTAYDLVNLYLTWNATKDIVFSASIDNLLNQYYRPYAIPGSSSDGTTQNDVLFSSPGPGRVYKAGLKIHFGGA